MNTSHTKTEWVVRKDTATGATDIRTIYGKPVAEMWLHDESTEFARLIAAAPDLLDALTEIVKSLSDADDEGMIEHAEQMVAARSAIAKATGETA